MRLLLPSSFLVVVSSCLLACHEGDDAAAGDATTTTATESPDATTTAATDVAGTDATADDTSVTSTDDTSVTTPDDTSVTTPDDTSATTPDDTSVTTDDTTVTADDTTTVIADTTVEPEVVVPTWSVVVNEVDCRGVPADWVEVVNVGATDVPLAEVWVSDDLDDPLHRTPLGAAPGVLAPGARHVVELTGYGVSCGSEGVFVGRFADDVLDAAPAGNDPSGHTYGRLPDTTGAFAINKPTRGAPNAAPDLDPFDQIGTLYDPLRPLPTIDLTLEDWAVDSLFDDPYAWVPGTFTLTDHLGTFTQAAAIRIKGRIGSFRDLNGKSAFKVDFDRFWPDARFRGVEALTLNNMVQDRAKTHEALAYALFRAIGVPAPRVGYVWVRVNGDDFGLYANIESYEDPFFDKHFASTKAMFEGQYGDDLFTGTAFEFDLDEGTEAGRIDLMALIDAVQAAPDNGFMAATAAFVDWDEVTRMMATEVLIGHWDGYAPTRNNYYLVVDDGGVFRLMAWGTDQTFEDNRAYYSGNGLLMQGCVNDPPCRTLYEDALVDLAVIVQQGDVLDALRGVPAVIQPYIDTEPREGGGVNATTRFAEAESFIRARAADVIQSIGCSRDPDLDLDGDGAACDLDCDEGDPTVYVGAKEICGDFIDQDCNDRIDDGADCPDCSERLRNGRSYQFCLTPRNHDAAVTTCSDMGMTLVIINNTEENTWLRDQGRAIAIGSMWLGLDDIAQEGTFVWDDGVPAANRFRDWMSGEPNNYGGGEDCVQMLPDQNNDTWNDLSCGSQLSAVCEQL